MMAEFLLFHKSIWLQGSSRRDWVEVWPFWLDDELFIYFLIEMAAK